MHKNVCLPLNMFNYFWSLVFPIINLQQGRNRNWNELTTAKSTYLSDKRRNMAIFIFTVVSIFPSLHNIRGRIKRHHKIANTQQFTLVPIYDVILRKNL